MRWDLLNEGPMFCTYIKVKFDQGKVLDVYLTLWSEAAWSIFMSGSLSSNNECFPTTRVIAGISASASWRCVNPRSPRRSCWRPASVRTCHPLSS